MECRHCSLTIPDDSAFCPECGRNIEPPVPVSASSGRAAVGAGPRHGDVRAVEPVKAPEEVRREPTPWATTPSPSAAPTVPSTKRGSNRGWLVLAAIVLLGGAIALVAWLASGDGSDGGDGGDGGSDPRPYELVADFETTEPAGAQFEATAGDLIVVKAFAAEEGADPVVHLWGPDGGYWVNDDSGDTVDAYLEVNASTSGTYEFLVAPFDEAAPGLMYLIVELNP